MEQKKLEFVSYVLSYVIQSNVLSYEQLIILGVASDLVLSLSLPTIFNQTTTRAVRPATPRGPFDPAPHYNSRNGLVMG